MINVTTTASSAIKAIMEERKLTSALRVFASTGG